MNSRQLFFIALALLATITSINSSPTTHILFSDTNKNSIGTNGLHAFQHEDEHHPMKRKSSRFLAQKPRAAMSCDKYPRVCSNKGSVGPDCCKKQCVNVMNDKVNCGFCGKKCKYQENCCKGLCVNPSFDGRNCGKCNNRCKKGSSCQFGMCSYA